MAGATPQCRGCGKPLPQPAPFSGRCGTCEGLTTRAERAHAPTPVKVERPSIPAAMPDIDLSGGAAAKIDVDHFAPTSTPTQPGKPKGASFTRAAKPPVPRPSPTADLARPPSRFIVTRSTTSPPKAIPAPPGLPSEAAASAAPVVAPPGQAPSPEEPREAVFVPAQAPPAAQPAMEAGVPSGWEVVSSVEYGARPEPGMQDARYHWHDLLDGDPPPQAKEGEGAYCVYHAIEVDESVRITYQTFVSVRAERRRKADDEPHHTLVVDSRTSVQRRALLEVMDGVRTSADQTARRRREATARRLARQRGSVILWNRILRPVGFALIRVEARISYGFINGRRDLQRALVEIPDAIVSSSLRVYSHLSTRTGRQGLFAGIRDPSTLNTEQRSVTLFLTTMLLAFLVLFLNSFFALAWPGASPVYRQLLFDAGLQFIGLFGLPIPIEAFFIPAVVDRGAVLAVTGFFVGKVLGSWVMYLLGDSLRAHLKASGKGKENSRVQRSLAWLERNASKYGFTVLVLDNAIPFAPDQVLLVFAVSGIKFRTWMWGIALGTLIKFAAIIYVIHVLGPETVEHFFENPLAFLQ